MRVRRSSMWAFALLAPTLLACGDGAEPGTAVDVFLAADACSAAAADEIAVTVLDETGATVEAITASLGGTSPAAELPTGVRVAAGEQPDASFRVVAELRAGGVPISRLSASGTYVPKELTELRLLFDDACLGIECGDGRTCIDAICVDDFMPPPASPHATRATCPPIVYVDSVDGSDVSGCGPIDAPCASIEPTVRTFSNGGNGAVVNVRGDRTYTSDENDLLNIAEAQSGSVTAPLVIRAWPGTGRPLLDGRLMNDKVVDVSGNHIVIQGLEVTGGVEHGITMNGAENRFITVRDVVAHGNGAGPSSFDNRAAINVNNNASDLLIEGCELRDNRSSVTGETTAGVHSNLGIRITIRNNRITGNDRGIHTSAATANRIEGNTLVGNGMFAISAGDDTEIVGNRVCDHEAGVLLRPGSTPVRVENNSVARITNAAIEIVSRPVAMVRANIVTLSGTGISVGGDDITDSHNLYFDNDVDFSGFTPDMPDTDVFANPRFEDPMACDLDIQPGSPALGSGPDGGVIGAL